MTTHVLKTWPQYFARVVSGEKTFEVRMDDRGFQTGDGLILREFDRDRCTHNVTPCADDCFGFTGRELSFKVGFIYRHAPGWLDCGDFVVMSLLLSEDDGAA